MKEILYIQAGTQANYIGTHFWNTQESYFTYEDGEVPETDHGISFREGLNQKGEPTFCPRLLAFDHKAQFGTLNQANALFGMDASADEHILWPGNPVEYKQEPVSKSHYQIDMDMEELDINAGYASSAVQLEDIQYWSDFNRLFYVPRTIQKIPDIPEWEDAEGNWTGGHEMFTRYDEDTGLMEGPLRLFLEECETIQGIQLMHDTSTFGSFVDAFLTSVRDDFAKMPLFSWPLLSDVIPFKPVDNTLGVRKLINDALAMRSLSELSSLSVPIQSPTTWTDEVCSNTYMHASRAHAYHTSAIMSAHIETVTFPLRRRATKDDILSFSAPLTWTTAVPFAELKVQHPAQPNLAIIVMMLREDSPPRPSHLIMNSSTAPVSRILWYPVPTLRHILSPHHSLLFSVPPRAPLCRRAAPGRLEEGSCLNPARSLSSLLLGGTRGFFSGYAQFLDDNIRRRKNIVENAGIDLDLDEMGDLANDLWTLHDNVGGETDDPGSDGDVRGEDED
ncbi:MtDNA inheritance protein Dml1 [Mycena venus]|uniref:MtDNA inheritance protein Dml1 n=1 Tax=Mycena venus TaxID=2733690 RepID=A0A8H6YWK3_9AGAR|nr:MtDNA inheritance protein Dml1 [Mycena venus]